SCIAAISAGRGCTLMPPRPPRSEEHTSELQSRENLVCRLLLEKKKRKSVRCKQFVHKIILLPNLKLHVFVHIHDIFFFLNKGDTPDTNLFPLHEAFSY